MSEAKIKELDKSLIHQANSNSMSGKRGDISAHEYEVYCQKVMSWNIPDSRKQKIVDQIYAKWSEQLRHEAAHVSVAVAGPARYNAKKLDHSDTILRLSSEFVEWFNGLQEQVWQGRIQELRHQTDDLLQCAAPVGEARDRPECYRLHLLRMRPSRGPRKESRGHSQRSAGADYGHHQQALRLRRTEMARNSVCKTAILFVFGGLVYFGLEVLFRGHSHWTMFVLGGFLFLILGELNEGLLEWDTPLIWQGVLGSAIVTGAELATGMILNVWLGLGVWDYSGMLLNYKGQICLPFSILWIFVSIAAVVLDDWLRYWLFGEERPHYTLFRRGESR